MKGKKEPTPVAAPEEDLLRMREVAKILGCSIAQAYRLADDEVIPTCPVGGMKRTPRGQLMTWIAKNSKAGASAA